MEVSEIGFSFLRGATFLFFGRIISYILNFIGFILIARLLAIEYKSAEALGWLLILTFILQLFIILGHLGLEFGIMKKIIIPIKEKKYEEASQYAWTFFLFNLFLWLIYSLLSFIFGNFVLTFIYSKPEIAYLVPIVSLGIIANFFYRFGWIITIILDKTWVNGLMLIIYSILQAVLAPLLLILGYKIIGVALVYFIIMPLLASIPSLIFFIKSFKFKLFSLNKLKEMLKFGFLINISYNYLFILSQRPREILISRFASAIQLGNFSIAQRFSPLTEIVLYPIQTLLFPNFSKIKKNNDLKIAFEFIIKILAFTLMPLSLFLLFFSKQLIEIFFGSYYIKGWIYLSLLSIYWFLFTLGSFVFKNIIATRGEGKILLKYSVIDTFTIVLFSLILIPFFLIEGAIIALILGYFPSYLLMLNYAYKKYQIQFPIKIFIKIFITSFILVLISYYIWLSLTNFINQYLALLISTIQFFITYTILTKKIKIFKESELNFIENTFKTIPFLNTFMTKLIIIYKKI